MERGHGKKRREEGNRSNGRSEKQIFEDEIAKLEMIRDRYPVSFREAKAALNEANGDLVEALEYLESRHVNVNQDMKKAKSFMNETKEVAEDYLDEAIDRTSEYIEQRSAQAKHQAWDFWHNIQESTIAIRRKDEVVARIPATIGIAGLAGSLVSPRIAMFGVLGLAGALGSGYNLELHKKEKSFKHDHAYMHQNTEVESSEHFRDLH